MHETSHYLWVCVLSVPSWYHNELSFLPLRYSTAAAPIFPSIPDPSEYTCIWSLFLRCSSSSAPSFIVSIQILTFGRHFGPSRTALIVSIISGLMLYLCMRSCRGVGCVFTSLAAASLTGLYSRCVGGSVASHIAALWRTLSTRRWKGRRFA